MDIKDFLLARIAEDEAAVAKPVSDLPVTRVHHPHAIKDVPGHPGATVEIPTHDRLEVRPVAATYSADPARVLRECAAKRAIVGMHRNNPSPFDEGLCTMCTEAGVNAQAYPCDTIKALAAIYSDHPDYQQRWAV